MQVSLTTTQGLERRLEVAVPAAEVSQQVEQRLQQLSRTARLKGFRPGKAPVTVVRKQFGDQVHAEVVGDLMRSSFAEAVSREQLKPAAGPRIEPIDMQPGADLKYAAVFEVIPEVKLAPLENIAVERPTASVTDADLEAMIENMRGQRPNYTEVTRGAQAKDRVTVDYAVELEGKPLPEQGAKDVSFIAGNGQVVAELDSAVIGAVAGDARSASVHYPEGHASPQLAGKSAQFNVTVKKVEEPSLPPLDEEFFKSFGVSEGGIDALRTEVRTSMERELASVIHNRLRGQVLEALARENPIEVPRALVEESVQQMQLDTARRTGARDVSQLPPVEVFQEPARRRVALGMILAEVIRAGELKIDRARVQSRLEEISMSYPNPEEARRAYLQNPEAMRGVESAVLEDQAVDFVLTRAKVTDKPSTFKELTGFGQPQRGES